MTEKTKKQIKVKILRYNPTKDKEPRYETYAVPFETGISVLNLLQSVYEIDTSLAFSYSCRIGRCGGCGVFANGKAVLACCTLVTDDILIEPPISLGFRIAKDLIYSHDLNEWGCLSLPRRNAFYRFNEGHGKAKKGVE